MPLRSLFIILITSFLAMVTLYAPQPIFPLLAARYGVSETAIASLVTWSLLPMAVAPLFVGGLLQIAAPRRLLAASAFLIGLLEIAFALVEVFPLLLALRFVHGALVSMLLAATMTYVSVKAYRIGRVMGFYVAATVVGGLLGRVGTSYGVAFVSPDVLFAAYGIAFVGAAFLALTLDPEPQTPRQQIRWSRLWTVVRTPLFALSYGIAFGAFFIFTALLNFLPFRVETLVPGTVGAAGVAYIGFVFGLVATLLSEHIAGVIGGALRAVALGSCVLVLALSLAYIEQYTAVVAAVFVASPGFFLVHATLSGFINRQAGEAGSINGLYVAFYYAGGTAGSYFPGFVYAAAGWSVFLSLLLGIGAAVLILVVWAMREARSIRAS